MAFTYFNKLIEKKYPHLDEEEQRNVFVFYVLCTILAVAIAPWIFVFYQNGSPILGNIHIGLVLGMVVLMLCSAFLNIPFKVSRFFLVVIAIFICGIPPIIMGNDSNTILNMLLLPMGMILIFSRKEQKTFLIYLGVLFIAFGFVLYWTFYREPYVQFPKEVLDNFNFSDLINTMLTAIAIAYVFWRKNSQLQHLLIEERKKSDNLLINILPEPIAKKLRGSGDSVVDSFEKVTILFADIVGFTRYSETMSPQQLVDMLDEVFSDFDKLADKYNVEKIKTIGDAYMAVGGLPIASVDHCQNVADFALEIDQLVKEKYSPKYNLQLRIGINTGRAIAGVIGTKKFSYDLWGSSVNTASRFEAQGVPGKIHVTEDVYKLLDEDYDIVHNGEVIIKGKGVMDSYFLLGKKGLPKKEYLLEGSLN